MKEAEENVSREKLPRAGVFRSSVVQTMMKLLEARDFLTEGHAERMEVLSDAIAKELHMSARRRDALRLFTKFHDIGKVGISDRILFKPGPLDEREWQDMQKHSEIGYHIALSSPDLMHISEWVLRHHEKWDGSGYPLSLKGEEIPLECRILALTDSFDAMTNDRPYRQAMSVDAALTEMRRCSGTQLDPALVDVFARIMRREELPGSRSMG